MVIIIPKGSHPASDYLLIIITLYKMDKKEIKIKDSNIILPGYKGRKPVILVHGFGEDSDVWDKPGGIFEGTIHRSSSRIFRVAANQQCWMI